MNTSSVSVNMTTAAVGTGMLRRPIKDINGLHGRAALHPARVGSKGRPRFRALPAQQERTGTGKAARSVWIRLPSETVCEKVMLGLLTLAAAAAIGYGFLSLLEYVQNWAVINAWVARLLAG